MASSPPELSLRGVNGEHGTGTRGRRRERKGKTRERIKVVRGEPLHPEQDYPAAANQTHNTHALSANTVVLEIRIRIKVWKCVDLQLWGKCDI